MNLNVVSMWHEQNNSSMPMYKLAPGYRPWVHGNSLVLGKLNSELIPCRQAMINITMFIMPSGYGLWLPLSHVLSILYSKEAAKFTAQLVKKP